MTKVSVENKANNSSMLERALVDWSRYKKVTLDPKDRGRLLANGFEPLPLVGKACLVTGWRSSDPTKPKVEITDAWLTEQLAKYPNHTGTGNRTGEVIGLDVDVTDDAIADIIAECAVQVFGHDLISRRGSKGFLVPLLCAKPFGKKTLAFTDAKGSGHKIEVLAEGQQFGAFGHVPVNDSNPAAFDYSWLDGRSLLDVMAMDLPMADESAVDSFLAVVRSKIEAIGCSAGITSSTLKNKSSDRGPAPFEDHPDIVEDAMAWLKSQPGATQGQGGDNHTYQIACKLRGQGCSFETTRRLLWENFNDRCEPMWDFDGADSLTAKVKNAFNHAQNKAGAEASLMTIERITNGVNEAEEVPAHMRVDRKPVANDNSPGKADEPSKAAEKINGSELFADCFNSTVADSENVEISDGTLTKRDGDVKKLRGVEYIYGGVYGYGIVSMLAAPGGSAKTITLLLRFVLASVGKKYLVDLKSPMIDALLKMGEVPQDEPIKSWYWNMEDSRDDILLRIHAICQTYGIAFDEVAKNLRVNGSEDRLKFASITNDGTVQLFRPNMEKVAKVILDEGIHMFGVDPYAKLFTVPDENSNAAMGAAAESLTLLASDMTNKMNHPLAIPASVHTVKISGKSMDDYLLSGPRGGGATRDYVRVVEMIVPMHAEKNDPAVPKDQWSEYFYLHINKRNYGSRHNAEGWLRTIGQDMPAYEGAKKQDARSIGVVVPALNLTSEAAEKAKQAMEVTSKDNTFRQEILTLVAARYVEHGETTVEVRDAGRHRYAAIVAERMKADPGMKESKAKKGVTDAIGQRDAITRRFTGKGDCYAVEYAGRKLTVTWCKGSASGAAKGHHFRIAPRLETVETEVPI